MQWKTPQKSETHKFYPGYIPEKHGYQSTEIFFWQDTGTAYLTVTLHLQKVILFKKTIV